MILLRYGQFTKTTPIFSIWRKYHHDVIRFEAVKPLDDCTNHIERMCVAYAWLRVCICVFVSMAKMCVIIFQYLRSIFWGHLNVRGCAHAHIGIVCCSDGHNIDRLSRSFSPTLFFISVREWFFFLLLLLRELVDLSRISMQLLSSSLYFHQVKAIDRCPDYDDAVLWCGVLSSIHILRLADDLRNFILCPGQIC